MEPADTAGISCGPRCHDNDPWIHSPYLDQVRRADGSGALFVPPMETARPPYRVVGTAFEDWRLEQIQPADNGCVACHRIGTGGSCSTFARYAGGDGASMPLTEHARTFPQSHWMPPGGAGSVEDWEATWRADLQQILDCCDDPSDPACNRSDLPAE